MFARRMCGGNYRELVGAEGFEPSAFCSRSKRATRLRYAPTSKRMSIVYSFFLFMSNGVSAKIANQRLVPTISVALGMIAWADIGECGGWSPRSRRSATLPWAIMGDVARL